MELEKHAGAITDMLKWRRRREGFEWREYVRTTILVRRKRRRDRIEEAGRAAVDSLAQVGKRSALAGRSGAAAARHSLGKAGQKAWGLGLSSARWGRQSARKSRKSFVPIAKAAADRIARAGIAARGLIGDAAHKGSLALGRAARQSGERAGPVLTHAASLFGSGMRNLAAPQTALPLAIAGGAAALGAAIRIPGHGFDTTAVVATTIAAVLLLLASLPVLSRLKWPSWLRVPGLSRFMDGLPRIAWRMPASPRLIGAIAVCIIGVLGIASAAGWMARQSPIQIANAIPLPWGPKETVAGYAVSLSGDMMRIDGKTVRMAGIEAPELTQTCSRANAGTWNCGQSALSALRRLTGHHTITCNIQKIDAAGNRVGTCRAGDIDLAAEMVRNGHVFASGGLFTTYGSEQAEAQSAKAGIWSGTAKSPKDYRNERWETASRDAPQGCPIKGRMVANGKIYILPWSRNYEKYRVRDSRGDRWFCSEDEARSDGWVPDI